MKLPRLYKRGPSWYHVSRNGKDWTKLSQSREEAERLWHRVEAGNAGTFSEVIDRYMRHLSTLDRSPATVKTYRLYADKLRKVFGNMNPRKIQPKHIGEYLDRFGNVAANREMSFMSVVCAYGMRIGLMDANPCRGVQKNSERRRTRYITPGEMIALKKAAGHLAPAVDLAYLTAARRGDLLRLTWDDVTTEGIVIRPQKISRVAPMCILVGWSDWLRSTVDWLRDGKAGPTLIRRKDGKPYTITGWNSAWRRVRDKAGVDDVHFHDIRGTALTDAERTRPMSEVQALAGHRNQSMTEAYIRVRAVIPALPVG